MVFIHLSLRFGEVFLVGTEFEEAVVEIHDVSERTVVGLQLREVEMAYQVVLINIESLVLIGPQHPPAEPHPQAHPHPRCQNGRSPRMRLHARGFRSHPNIQ